MQLNLQQRSALSIRTLLMLWVMLLGGCATVYKPQNQPIETNPTRYDTTAFDESHHFGENVIILAFSGGGTRAAALSYGVLKELEKTVVQGESRFKRYTLLDEVDFISSVSGGSFTAAYYGAFGKGIFDSYEKRFLKQSNESALISKMLSPSYWWKSLTSFFDRTELAIEYYDQHVFKRKTFADIRFEEGPYIVINATDLSLGQRFAFEQDTFDLLCSDLSDFPLARAVTASSAVPIVFPSVVLKNYSEQCFVPHHQRTLESTESSHPNNQTQKAFLQRLASYRDAEKKRYVHLVDGGLSDNLGLRAISDNIEVFGLKEKSPIHKKVKRVYIILVNSSVEPEREMDSSPRGASVAETLDAFTEALIQNRSADTKSYFFDENNEFEKRLKSSDPTLEVYSTEVTFKSIKSEEMQRFFNKLPTSLELPEEQVDQIIEAGGKLLREDASFQAFLKSISGGQ